MSGYTSSKPGCARAAGAHASSAERTYLATSSGPCWSSHSEYCGAASTSAARSWPSPGTLFSGAGRPWGATEGKQHSCHSDRVPHAQP